MEELTISFFCTRYPGKLIHHLKFQRKYIIKKVEPEIYHAEGDIIPIQIVITSELSEKDNLWLKNLTNEIKQTSNARELIYEYKKHKDNHLYRSVMDLIVRVNKEKFEEVKDMCEALEALEELMKDELDAARKPGIEQGL